jgi:transcriptional regulator with XRE-family HTH domain
MARKNQAASTPSMTHSDATVARIIGRRLRVLRAMTGRSQAEISRSLNTDRSMLSRWERGSVMPRLSSMVRLANLYGVEVSSLLCNGPTTKREKGE